MAAEPARLWNPSEAMSPRVRRLRDEYFAFRDRPHFRNEVMPFGTGTAWDTVFAVHNWTIVPEVMPFLRAYEDSLTAMARPVPLPPGFWQEPLPVRRALFFAAVCDALPVQILEGELVVGGRFNTAMSLCLTKAETAAYQPIEDRFNREAYDLDGLGLGNCGAVPGHIIPDYREALRIGLSGLVRHVESLDAPGTPAEVRASRRALVICAKGAHRLALRYAAEAERLAAAEPVAARRAELEAIGRACRTVPWEPPSTLPEALQALWLLHMLVMTQEGYPGPGLSLGRIDQFLYPYYRDDLAAGRLDRDGAREWLQCWWLKHNYAYDYQGRVGNNQGITAGYGQLVTLGGIDAAGNDASNPLTWLLLDVIEDMNTLEPKPNVRLHKGTPPDLMRRVAGMIAGAQGSPFLLNFDERSIEGLRWQGLPEERLWDYAPVGCLENTLQGDDRSGTVDVNLNLAKCIELALFDGRDLATGRQVGPRTGEGASHDSFASFHAAVMRQLDHQVDRMLAANDLADDLRARFQPTPYLSLLVGGCAENGRDVTAGGARHNWLTVEGVALATAVDSLAAVRQVVFEDRRLSMAEVVAAVRADFEGHEKARLLLVNKAPKYGNDDDAVDGLARDFSHAWCERVRRHVSPTGKRYRGGYLSWNYWVCYGPKTAATPDGRPRGRFLSNGSCPVTGRDRHGPTANARSCGKLGLETAPNGDSHTISLSPSLLRDPEHVDKLAAFLRAYTEVGGTALQVNVLDTGTLRAAQADPAGFRNLLVRVTGYNAYFVTLGKEIQDEIIARESHGM